MFKITTVSEYIDNNYVTPSYILDKKIYLPCNRFDRDANLDIQFARYYDDIVSLLYVFRFYLIDGEKLVNDNTLAEIELLKQAYPILNTAYADSCSTIFNFLNAANLTFEDVNINNIYQAYLNKTAFTTYSTNIINEVRSFINSKLVDYNNKVTELNSAGDFNYDLLPVVINFITQNYLTLIEDQLTIYTSIQND